eukprot:CAMPEP_0198146710 /NCGR_PEP_ID=MMETSP1443-20131203/30992_1 /TAXON_ID=186043 /ORGANISM="Entomoneis sp., Strain CCMP2396" /LENGTH=129 /DNA_ID=CAMNT_0043810763 /DNA_START=133 /DNA_END=522 /DNA_ORIENTATION=-
MLLHTRNRLLQERPPPPQPMPPLQLGGIRTRSSLSSRRRSSRRKIGTGGEVREPGKVPGKEEEFKEMISEEGEQLGIKITTGVIFVIILWAGAMKTPNFFDFLGFSTTSEDSSSNDDDKVEDAADKSSN